MAVTDLPLGCDAFERNYSDSWTWGGHLQQQELASTNPALPLRRGCNASRFDCLVWFSGGMQFGTHICLCVEQTRRNPFTCNSAKLPRGQALHLKCTISYPCLLSMQHFWDINPEGEPQENGSGDPHTLCLPVVYSLSSSFFFFPVFTLVYPGVNWKVRVVTWEGASAFVSFYGVFIECWQGHKHACRAPRSGLRE